MTEPKWLTLAKAEVGTKEFAGSKTNPVVANYYKDAVGTKHPDAVPWCAAFVGAMLSRAGIQPSGSLLARSYANWGIRLSKPIPGAIAVFSRGRTGGHVAFVVADAGGSLKIVGGNQSNAVTITNRSKATLIGYRWPKDAPMLKGLTLPIAEEQPQKFMITGYDIEIEECELP